MMPSKYAQILSDLKTLYLSDPRPWLVGFSGGTDSTLLLKVTADVLGERVLAVTASSETYPKEELKEAREIAGYLGVKHKIIKTGEWEDVHFLDYLVHAICFVFDENPFTSLGAATGTDDIMYSLYTYPEWQMGHDVPLHTRVYSEIRFIAVNPEIFIRIHISIPQYSKNLMTMGDELYAKIWHPSNCHNFISSDTLSQFNQENCNSLEQASRHPLPDGQDSLQQTSI